ncbi:MAG: D-alanyl-D-alanine carboxypeptidase [Alphaproteobacteria bacterium]|nr:D-alanyl-D-alanine carboxypeptidase [Alphaproteobacteria bacterium]
MPKSIVALGILIAAGFQIATAQALETSAKQVVVIELTTGAVLYEKDANSVMYPASMTKIMTAYLLFERLKNGSLSLEDMFRVSEAAWRKGGSKMFVKVGDRVSVEDLIRGIIVQSGNDATIVVAEGIGGSETAFADLMTEKARELGMSKTTFRNASGWPDPDHVTSARDLAILAERTIRDFPEYYHYYSELSFTYNKIKQSNRNPLLYKKMGADGLKTGHTEASGYGLTASASRNERRLVVVANGFGSVKARAAGSERLIDWGFRTWNNYELFTGGEKVADAQVWLGDAETVPVVIKQPLVITIPRKSREKLKVAVSYEEPIPAPITAGTRIATLIVSAPDTKTIEVPLFAGGSVGQLGPVGRLGEAFRYLVWGGKL